MDNSILVQRRQAESNASLDNAGRISKTTFSAVTGTFWVLMVAAFFIRLYIRLSVQRQFSSDDWIICAGIATFVAGMSLVYSQIEGLMVTEALISNPSAAGLSLDLIYEALASNKWSASALTLMWFSINCVKLSFLLLFKRLIHRIRPLTVYWWVVLVYTVFVFLGGITAYFVPCPYFEGLQGINCISGGRRKLIIGLSLAQNVADIIGDCLILALPVTLISKIQVGWAQKIALGSSLCLTAVLIVATIVRAAGIEDSNGNVDIIWVIFWQVLSTEIGLILSCVLVFRVLFVDRKSKPTAAQPGGSSRFLPARSHARRILSGGASRIVSPTSADGTYLNRDTGIGAHISDEYLQTPTAPTMVAKSIESMSRHNTSFELADRVQLTDQKYAPANVERV